MRAGAQVWLKQPLVNLSEITERHDIVEAFVEDPTLRERLRNLHLRGMPASTLPPPLMPYYIQPLVACRAYLAGALTNKSRVPVRSSQ